jgi:3-dehydroquinate dehydratase-2
MRIAVIQGPNLNLLGIRDQNIYGPIGLDTIHEQMQQTANDNQVEVEFFQSNLEGELVDRIQECLGEFDGIIINPAAYSHTSIAIKDALEAVRIPAIEVHISNIYRREEYRQKSITASSCTGVVSGLGPLGYQLALISIIQMLSSIKSEQEQAEQQQQAIQEATHTQMQQPAQQPIQEPLQQQAPAPMNEQQLYEQQQAQIAAQQQQLANQQAELMAKQQQLSNQQVAPVQQLQAQQPIQQPAPVEQESQFVGDTTQQDSSVKDELRSQLQEEQN